MRLADSHHPLINRRTVHIIYLCIAASSVRCVITIVRELGLCGLRVMQWYRDLPGLSLIVLILSFIFLHLYMYSNSMSITVLVYL